MATARDPALSKLAALFEETLALTTDTKVKENLVKAQKIASAASEKSKGILNKFALDGKVALVTGGGQGIGRALAHGLGEAGCKVAVADLELSRTETVVAELQAKGIQSLAFKVDVSKKQEVEEMVEKVISTFGDLDIGVNNAGIVFSSNSEETSEQEWSRTLDVNLTGLFYCCQAEAKHMLKKKSGRIINTGSICATVSTHPQHQVAYNTSKAGVLHLTKTLGTEWSDRGVTLNCISPGCVDTPMIRVESLLPYRKLWIRDTPVGRLAEVDDLVGGVLYLASPLASYTTGLNLLIDGGFTCW